ncbi:vitamin K-dependent gamma-carboxylase [Helicoverpa zea]|uniref:vitamin K-dependent gamma-carboxylase n=1 Tax=Helicoverpa zea TaxID=7113 RepID=UPI001F576C8B|nr:vitamin K-dependent gamma-carboxylase [Helicoverpa zea]
MKAKEKMQALYQKVDEKFYEQFGFKIKEASMDKLVDYMYTPKDSSSLAVTRILFGLAMLFDIPDERGGATMDKRWGDPNTCHFPLFPGLTAVGMPYMAVVYAALWVGALCIMLGYKFRITAPMFTICYWYLLLIEKSFWNNHSYLFGLVALLLSCTEAECYWSLDAYLDPSKRKPTVPYWNYFVLKYQFFILYFMAGMKKGTAEWLTGYSVQNLSEHWVFDPFKYFLTVQQTDYLVVHWFVFVFDLTVALWMMWSITRHVAMVFCALFHLMNSRLFRIGMFPWVCLATMPLFYPFDWPKTIASYAFNYYTKLKRSFCYKIQQYRMKSDCDCKINNSDNDKAEDETMKVVEKEDSSKSKHNIKTAETNTDIDEKVNDSNEKANIDNVFDQDKDKITKIDEQKPINEPEKSNSSIENNSNKNKVTIYLILSYVFIQAFLPYSHFMTKGYNNWTNGLYGYSWDMMIHTWDISSVVVKVVDNQRQEEIYIDPEQYTLNDRWSKHGDMLLQYAHCLKNNLERMKKTKLHNPSKALSNNISIYVDIWCSMNGRFVQRMFDSKTDLLKASWSPFSEVPYLMPLLDEAVHWRKDMDEIRSEVHSWSEHSDVIFFADFPGYDQEKYIPLELQNVTLTVLEGQVVFEPEVTTKQIGQSFKLTNGHRIHVHSGMFHRVLNVGKDPAFYMYTFFNATDVNQSNVYNTKLPIFRELFRRFTNMFVFGKLVVSNVFQLFKYSQCSSS